MFRTFARNFLPNPLDWKLKRAKKRGAKTVLLCWNRGLGDIALGLAAIIHRIRDALPDARISVLTRKNLKEGFTLLDGLEILVATDWERGGVYDWREALPGRSFDLVLEKPSPTDWCQWQHKRFTPRLKWVPAHDKLSEKFDLEEGFTYIGVQVVAETQYGLWRNFSLQRWNELFDRLEKRGNIKVLLFGFGSEIQFPHPMICDLRGKTSFFELLSIIKNRCTALIVPDSGLTSMTYYLDLSFPIRLITLWADPNHGILKQGVASPNPKLVHIPLIGQNRSLNSVSAEQVENALFPKKTSKPLLFCESAETILPQSITQAACVIMAGGQGSRLGFLGPKGLFPLLDKTLFQHLLEKIPLAMPVAIMISPQNSEATKTYFEKNNFFGRNILFFEQTALPLLDGKYRAVGWGPDGNGSVYASLLHSGILGQFERLGVQSVFFNPIDNPLADPADGRLLALDVDVAIKCVKRIKGESMGALTEELSVVEYFDVDKDHFSYSYTGQVALSLKFIKQAANLSLPLHWVRKKASISGSEMSVWKREKFLFDAFPFAAKRGALCYERQMCYAPIKGAEQKEAVEKLLRKKT